MKQTILLLSACILILLSCSKPTEIKQIPSEFVGDWNGKINLDLRGEIDSKLHLKNDSMNFTYDEFDKTYKIDCVIEKIEIEKDQKCQTCNDEIITVYYKTVNDDNNDYTPYISKMWLSDKNNQNKFELLFIDQKMSNKGDIQTWKRLNP